MSVSASMSLSLSLSLLRMKKHEREREREMNRKTAGWKKSDSNEILLTLWSSVSYFKFTARQEHSTLLHAGQRTFVTCEILPRSTRVFDDRESSRWCAYISLGYFFFLLKLVFSFVRVAMEAIAKHDNCALILCSKATAVAFFGKLSIYCAWEDSPHPPHFVPQRASLRKLLGMCLINDPVS